MSWVMLRQNMVRVLSRRPGDICDWLPRIVGLDTNMTIPNPTDKVAWRQRHVGICRRAIAKRHGLDSLSRSSLLWGRRTRPFQSRHAHFQRRRSGLTSCFIGDVGELCCSGNELDRRSGMPVFSADLTTCQRSSLASSMYGTNLHKCT